MRVLHVTTGKTWRGGEQQLLYLARGLRRRGIEQQLVCRKGTPMHLRARAENLPVVPMPILNEIDVRAMVRIANRARRFRADLLHLHTSQAHGLGAIAARMNGRRRPAVIVSRRVDFSIFRHSFLGLDRFKYDPGADHVLCVSGAIQAVLEKDGLPSSMLSVAHSGIDPARFDGLVVPREATRKSLGVPDGSAVVGTVGHLADHKGQRYLIEAMPEVRRVVPNAFLVLAGEGELRADLEARAKTAGVFQHMTFAGFRPDIPDVLRAFDVFAFPSHKEGLGTSVLDAMASRLPVVASAAGGIPEIIESGVNGVLVPPKDPPALAKALIRVLGDGAEAARLGAAARDRVTNAFSYEHTADATLAAYKRVLAQRQA